MGISIHEEDSPAYRLGHDLLDMVKGKPYDDVRDAILTLLVVGLFQETQGDAALADEAIDDLSKMLKQAVRMQIAGGHIQ